MHRQELPDGTEIAGWYVRAVKTGPFVFVSGTTSLDPNGRVQGRDAGAQTRATMRKIAAALKGVGASVDDITRLTMYCTDIRDTVLINDELSRWFRKSRCASALIGVSHLAVPGLLVEIEATAIVGHGL